MTKAQVEKKLTKAYLWRQRRYADGVHGRGCFNEANMAREIADLETRLEDLGGDPRECLLKARSTP